MAWGYIGGMPKVSVYLPDELYARAKARGLPLSALTQQAIEQALSRSALAEWVDQARRRPRRTTAEFDTASLMDEVRDEFGA